MAILALNTSAYRNAVSRLHRTVSQEMWQGLWPTLPAWETPITSVTNGVHLQSWINGDLSDLYDQYLEPDWRFRWNDPSVWNQISEIPDEELLEMHRRYKAAADCVCTRAADRFRQPAQGRCFRTASRRRGARSPRALDDRVCTAIRDSISAPRCCSATSSA